MATLAASLIAAARSTPSRTFIEAWDEIAGVVQRHTCTRREATDKPASAHGSLA